MNALDLFAGPGGWDVGARELGIDPLGIEWDKAACATREAAGLRTVRGDVAALTPTDFAPCDLLIASPPCQAWSTAGKRAGERDKEHVYACTDELARGIDRRAEHRGACEDERSILVVEAVRWALALRPRFIACEQVPPVLDYWRHVARILEAEGYSTWAGILSAERYGVPQTRRRAILMARLDGPVYPPQPTHQEYRPGEPAWDAPQLTLEGEIKPWVSMAEALGWDTCHLKAKFGYSYDPSAKPAGTVDTKVGDWRREWAQRRDSGPGAERIFVGENRANHAERSEDEPAPTITAQPGRHGVKWRERPAGQRRDSGPGAEREPRSTEEPSYTIRANGSGSNPAGVEWVEQPKLRTHANTRPNEAEHRRRPDGLTRELDEPAPTLDSRATGWTVDRPAKGSNPAGVEWVEGRNVGGKNWTEGRPSTAVCGDPRIFPPEYRGGATDYDEDGNYHGKRAGDGAVRVTIQEAAVLQGFPADYPWQGSRTKQFQQIGNAVPPPLARAVLAALTTEAGELREAA